MAGGGAGGGGWGAKVLNLHLKRGEIVYLNHTKTRNSVLKLMSFAGAGGGGGAVGGRRGGGAGAA